MDEIEYTFEKHVSFNAKAYAHCREVLIECAKEYGLVWEVLDSFHQDLENKFQSNDYPISFLDYSELANHALYEWDI